MTVVNKETYKKMLHDLDCPPEATPALIRVLNKIEKDKKKEKLYTEKQVREIIGNFANEASGWIMHFAELGGCCPGDDYSNIVNFTKVMQLKKAGLKVDKKEFERQTGSYLKYTEQSIKKYLKKIKSS